jgi:hypothetical protein
MAQVCAYGPAAKEIFSFRDGAESAGAGDPEFASAHPEKARSARRKAIAG